MKDGRFKNSIRCDLFEGGDNLKRRNHRSQRKEAGKSSGILSQHTQPLFFQTSRSTLPYDVRDESPPPVGKGDGCDDEVKQSPPLAPPPSVRSACCCATSNVKRHRHHQQQHKRLKL
jgi:hypothetical protein